MPEHKLDCPRISTAQLIAVIVFIINAVLGVGASGTCAQEKEITAHFSSGDILELSLKRLKESLDKTTRTSERLADENEALREEIFYYRNLRKHLIAKKSEMTGEPLPQGFDGYAESRADPGDLEGRHEQVNHLSALLKEEVGVLTRQVQKLDGLVNEFKFHERRKMMLGTERQLQGDLAQLEKQLKWLENDLKTPRKKIEVLQKQRVRLEAEMRQIRDIPYAF